MPGNVLLILTILKAACELCIIAVVYFYKKPVIADKVVKHD